MAVDGLSDSLTRDQQAERSEKLSIQVEKKRKVGNSMLK